MLMVMKRRFQDLPVTLQIIVLIALGATPAAGFFFLVVCGFSQRADTLRMRLDRLKAENDKCEVFRMQHSKYLRQTRELKRKLETLRTIVPDETADVRFLKTVYEVARGTGVRIVSTEARPLVANDFYGEISFNTKIEGAYQGLETFFERLAHEDRITNVQLVSLGPPEGRVAANYRLGPGVTVRATCVLTTYFNRPPPPPAPARAR